MINIPKIELHNLVQMPLIGLGTLRLNEQLELAIKQALEYGYTLIDTASYYKNEKEIGDLLKTLDSKREDLFITSKIWNDEHDRVEDRFYQSLQDLQLDYLDQYLIHWPVPERLESWRILEKLYQEKKCRSIGVSNFTIAQLEELKSNSEVQPAVNQIELSPWLQQKELVNYCREQNIQVVAYRSFAKGEKINDQRLIDIGKKYDKSAVQIIVCWLSQEKIVSLPKSGNPKHLRENIEVFDFELDDQDLSIISSMDEGYRICHDPAISIP